MNKNKNSKTWKISLKYIKYIKIIKIVLVKIIKQIIDKLLKYTHIV